MIRSRSRARGFVIGDSAPTTPLRIAEVNGRLMEDRNVLSSKTGFGARWLHPVGADQTHVKFWLPNFYFYSNSQELLTGNDYTISEMSVSCPATGITIPVYFSGSRSKVITNGAFQEYTDLVSAKQLGFSNGIVPNGTELWCKFLGTKPLTTSYVPWAGNGSRTSDFTGGQSFSYDPSVTFPSSTDVDGVYTFTGTAQTNQVSMLRPVLVGHPVVDGPSFIAFGDSITQGVGETTSFSRGGRGYASRAAYGDGTNCYPQMNIARGSVLSDMMVNGTKYRECLSWAKYAYGTYFTNDIQSGKTVAYMQGRFANVNTILRDNGIEKINWISLFQRGQSTDTYTTDVNQSPLNADWDAGGKAEQVNDWYPSQVYAGNIEGFWNLRAAILNGYLWKTDGVTAGLYTTDGVHPSTLAHTELSVVLRAFMDSLSLYDVSNTDMQLFLRPSETGWITESSGVVDAIADKSSYGRDFTQVSTARPQTGVSSIQRGNVLTYDGSNDYITRSSFLYDLGAYTGFVVINMSALSAECRIFAEGKNGNDTPAYAIGSRIVSGNDVLRVFYRPDSGSGFAVDGTIDLSDGEQHIIGIKDTGSNLKIYVDGVLDVDQDYTRAATTLNTMAIGGLKRTTFSSPYPGDIGDALFYSGILSDADFTAVQRSMACHNGILI